MNSSSRLGHGEESQRIPQYVQAMLVNEIVRKACSRAVERMNAEGQGLRFGGCLDGMPKSQLVHVLAC